MPDLTTPAGRDESRRKLGWCKQLGIESIDEVPVGDLLALLDQADAGAALAQRVIRAARLLGIANSDTEPNAAETQMLVDDILTHIANLADAGEREWRAKPPTMPGYYWWRWTTDTAMRIRELGDYDGDLRDLTDNRSRVASEIGGEWAGPLLPPPPARAAAATTEDRK
jgi:pyruvate/2-oxoglutarate dehydrogenase complex dihydrolipoamide acyltransferase (E2) component